MLQTLLIAYLLITIGNLLLLKYFINTDWFKLEQYDEPIIEVYYFNLIPVLQLLITSIVFTMLVLYVKYIVTNYEVKWYRLRQLWDDFIKR